MMTATKTFIGDLVLGEDDPLPVDVSIDVSEIRIVAGAVEIGTWPLADCSIQSDGDDLYRMEVDGDILFFLPNDAEAFALVIPHLGLETLPGVLARLGEQVTPEVSETGGTSFEFDELPEIDPSTFDFSEESIESIEIEPNTFEFSEESFEPIEIDPGPTDDPFLSPTFDSGLFEKPFEHPELELLPSGFETASESEDEDIAGQTSEVVAFDLPSEPEVDETESEPVFLEEVPDSIKGEASSEEPRNSEEIAAEVFEETAAPVAAIAATPSLIDRINQMAEVDSGNDTSPLQGFGRRLERRRTTKTSKVDSDEAADVESIATEVAETDVASELASTDAASEIASKASASAVGVVGKPADTDSLATAVAALRDQFGDDGPETVVDDILATQRSLRSSRRVKSDLSRNVKRVAVMTGVVAVVGGVVLGAFLLIKLVVSAPSPDPSAVETVPHTVATSVSVTPTTVTETTIAEPLEPTGFAITSPDFFRRWNETAAAIDPRLVLPPLLPGSFENQLTDFIAANGIVGESGSVTSIELVIDPSGSEDQLGMQALGLLIATVDPNLDGAERRGLLASLGLDVRNPILQGINGLTTYNGVTYTLVFSPEEVLLRFKAVG